MPPRWACVLIVAAWLAANGWLFYRDLLPRLRPDQPPPYTVDLLEEVQDRRWMRPVGWTVYRDGDKDKQVLSAKMRVEHPARDTFELIAEYRPMSGREHGQLHRLNVAKMTSAYRVNAAGDLLGVRFHLEGRLHANFVLDVTGDVEGERFRPTGRLRLPRAGLDESRELPEVAVRRGGGVVLPLHPVNRLRGLRPGQTWTAVAIDPVHDLMHDFGLGGEPRRLHCRVRDEEEPLGHGRRDKVMCHVIDMEGDGLTVRARVASDTGLVLAQEVTYGTTTKDHTALYRD